MSFLKTPAGDRAEGVLTVAVKNWRSNSLYSHPESRRATQSAARDAAIIVAHIREIKSSELAYKETKNG
jgi:hypothetical protein